TLVDNNTTRYANYGASFTGVLANATAENSTTHYFQLTNVSEEKANDLLKSRSIDALVIIPENFSSGFLTMVNNTTRAAITSSVGQQTIASNANPSPVFDPQLGVFVTPTPSVSMAGANVKLPEAGNTTATLIIEGDTGFVNFATSQALVTAIFDNFKNSVQASATAQAAPGTGNSTFADNLPVQTRSIAGTQSFSLFDYMVPGLIVFALLLQVALVTASLVKDVETGLLDRLKLSRVKAFDLLFGTFITWTLITVVQVLLLIGFAIALGYKYQGDFGTLGLAILIGIIAAMASIALALILSSFANTEHQAMGVSMMLSTPIGFLAGAFIPLPRQEIGEFAGRTYVLYDILPWTHAINALRSVLTYGSGLSADVVFEMTWLIVLTAILFVAGVVTYSRVRLRAKK
ncbi:MAG: ABC transporter permease, partial [Euryarchaeota archaeon]|nr:ABC transporter permease [Euryarchaeota archaeon]